jgi:Xaa-Pro dipeptidase
LTAPARADRGARRSRVAGYLQSEDIGAALFEDVEGRRDPAIRYLTGHPGDALLVIAADGRSLLIAWDLSLARLLANADEMLAYTDFARLPLKALAEALARLGIPKGSKVELPSTLAYPRFIDYVEGLPDYDLLCRRDGVGAELNAYRAIKDESEIAIYRKASGITNGLIDVVEESVRSGRAETELDVALLIERSSREAGCEGTGFETLAAGPTRSWGIHAFPAYGRGPFANEGMSILDFGLRLEGYTTDVTMSFVRGDLGKKGKRMLALVERVHDESIARLAPGISCREIARAADEVFEEEGYAMPHALGHGIGLEAHEAPALRNREDNCGVLAAGQIVTVEPGLYHPELGGLRYEDDILITATGHEVLTRSRIVRL